VDRFSRPPSIHGERIFRPGISPNKVPARISKEGTPRSVPETSKRFIFKIFSMYPKDLPDFLGVNRSPGTGPLQSGHSESRRSPGLFVCKSTGKARERAAGVVLTVLTMLIVITEMAAVTPVSKGRSIQITFVALFQDLSIWDFNKSMIG
jgi:hypothetical protein